MTQAQVFQYAADIFVILTLIVKFCPTIPAKYPILITILKLLGKITNNQTDDDAVRAGGTNAKS